jgi:hypothetical protein
VPADDSLRERAIRKEPKNDPDAVEPSWVKRLEAWVERPADPGKRASRDAALLLLSVGIPIAALVAVLVAMHNLWPGPTATPVAAGVAAAAMLVWFLVRLMRD